MSEKILNYMYEATMIYDEDTGRYYGFQWKIK